ncbi:hypothetical protein BY458DRAFT_552529 [Sporodiniella umbellata]|nr:hypothetical protein BY458DRAFT_552529 [Sporodiniella umbellata]
MATSELSEDWVWVERQGKPVFSQRAPPTLGCTVMDGFLFRAKKDGVLWKQTLFRLRQSLGWSDPRRPREIRVNPDGLRMASAERNMIHARKLLSPLKPRACLPKRNDPFLLDHPSPLSTTTHSSLSILF